MTGGTAPLPPGTRKASSDAITGASRSAIGAKYPPRMIACGLSMFTTVPSATPSQRPHSASAASAALSPSSARRTQLGDRLARTAGGDRPRRFSPAAASSGSRPARVSRHPREPHAHGRLVDFDGRVAEFAAEPAVAAE